MPYNKTSWKDTIKDASGNVIEKGTPLAAQHLNKMESGIENATQNAEKAVSDLAGVSQQLAEKANETDLVVERERISNLVANAGNTDGNSELLDIRVGDDGVTYDTAGDAFRARVGKVSSDIAAMIESNLTESEEVSELKNGTKDEVRQTSTGEYEIYKRVHIHSVKQSDITSVNHRTNYTQAMIPFSDLSRMPVPGEDGIQGTFEIKGWTEKAYTAMGAYVPNQFSTRSIGQIAFDLPLGTTIEEAREMLEGVDLKYQVQNPYVVSLDGKNINTKQLIELVKELDALKKMPYDVVTPTLYDSFNRADSPNLGMTEVGSRKYNDSGAFAIANNQAYSTLGGLQLATLDYGNSDCVIESDMTVGGGDGLAFRVSDIRNFMLVRVEPYNVRLYKREDAVETMMASRFSFPQPATDVNIKVSMKGTSVRVFVDGVEAIETNVPFNLHATSHGMYTKGENRTKFKNLSITPYERVSPLRIKESFESLPLPWYWKFQESDTPYSKILSDKYAKIGSKSMRFELRREAAPAIYRSELSLPQVKQLGEYWYNASIYLPNGGEEDYAIETTSDDVIMQWHNSPDLDEREEGVPPPLALRTTPNGRYSLTRAWDDAVTTTNAELNRKGFKSEHDLGSFVEDKGKWTNWSFRVKWGWTREQLPILEVYKNGEQLLNLNGLPNTFNDAVGPYWKLGLYKYALSNGIPMTVERRVAYYDDVSMYGI